MPHSTAETAAHTLKSNLLTTEEAAAYLGIKPRSLEVWRCVGRYGIPFIKVGRLVKYRKADLDAFLAARTHTPAIERA
jgi:excisionase family DNA binding protein